jgi:nucleoside-diphosphate-sugar epimerase
MLKVCITGTTRGLGKTLTEYFNYKGHEVIELNRGDDMIAPALGCDLYINNAYDAGLQIDLFNQLYNGVKKMIVMGSIASENTEPDPSTYSDHKRELKERVLYIANSEEEKADILLLQLTGNSYNDSDLVIRTIDFWLDNPKITCVSFVPGEPN